MLYFNNLMAGIFLPLFLTCNIMFFDGISNLMGALIGGVIQADSQKATNQKNYDATIATNEANERIANETNMSNRDIAAQTNTSNRMLADRQNEWNLQQWHRENLYNSPQAQMHRLRAAGLSAAAAAQAIEGAGNAAPLQSANLATDQIGNPMQGATMQAPRYDPALVPNILGMLRSIMDIRKEGAEATKAEAEANVWDEMILSDRDLKKADLDLKKQFYVQAAKSFPYSLRILKYKAKAEKFMPDMNKELLEGYRINNEQMNENIKLARQQFSFLEKMNDKKIDEMCEIIKNLQEQRNNLIKQGKNIDADTGLKRSQTELTKEQTETEKKKQKILTEQGFQEEIESVFKSFGYPDDVSGRVGALVAAGKLPANALSKMLIGTRDFVKEGHKYYGADPLTKHFLYYYWDKGSAAMRHSGIHTLAPWQEGADMLEKFGFPSYLLGR